VLVSGRLQLLTPSSAVFMIAMLQWITFGVTVAKFGLDIFIYAAVTRSDVILFDLAPFVSRFTIPAAVIIAGLSVTTFGFVNSVGCFLGIVLESVSIILIAEKTARSEYAAAVRCRLDGRASAQAPNSLDYVNREFLDQSSGR
jgi:hypothetical protein